MSQEQPLNVTKYETQTDQNNEIGRKILALYQEIDRLKTEVNFWREKYDALTQKTKTL